MNDSDTKTLFVDRFRPDFNGIQILMLQHLAIEKIAGNGLSSAARSVLKSISLELNEVISTNKIYGPTDCFQIFLKSS